MTPTDPTPLRQNHSPTCLFAKGQNADFDIEVCGLCATLDARELDVALKATVDVPEDAPPSGGDAHRWYLAGWTERADAIRAVLRGDQR